MLTFSAHAEEQEEVIDFISNKIRQNLIEEGYSEASQNNLEIIIEPRNLDKLKLHIDEIANLKLLQVNQYSSSFKGQIFLNKCEAGDCKKEIQGRYIEYAEIPVFKQNEKAGNIINEQDIHLIKINSQKISKEFFTNSNELIGKTPIQSMAANMPIRKRMITNVAIINKQDMVTVKYKKGSLELSMMGLAVDSGANGDRIRVQNTKSNAIIYGIARDNKIVEIN